MQVFQYILYGLFTLGILLGILILSPYVKHLIKKSRKKSDNLSNENNIDHDNHPNEKLTAVELNDPIDDLEELEPISEKELHYQILSDGLDRAKNHPLSQPLDKIFDKFKEHPSKAMAKDLLTSLYQTLLKLYPNLKEEAFIDHLHETYIAKNHDYGNSFEESILEFGVIAAVVRLNDKINRLKQLVLNYQKKALVTDESIQDTLLDAINYTSMLLMYFEK